VIYLLEAGGVMVLAGTAYGVSPYFRMSTATSVEQIEEGCRRIASAVAKLA
jgi:aspartate aminotransferase